MVHHVQVILICLHISQQIIRRDVAALRLLIVCTAQGKRNQLITPLDPPPSVLPSMPGCAQATQLSSPPLSLSPGSWGKAVLLQGPGARCPSPWGCSTFSHPRSQDKWPSLCPIYARGGRSCGTGLCPPRTVTLVVDQGGGGIHEDVFCAAFSFAAVQSGLAAQPSRDIFQVKAGEKRRI